VDIVLVDDHPILRTAVREVLAETRFDVNVVGEADTAKDAVAMVAARNADLVLMDVLLPGENGLAATREICRARPNTRVLIYTTLTEPSHALEALSAGASGYALKNQPIDELVSAIDQVGQGKRYLAPSIATAINEARQDGGGRGLASLSTREKEVFDLAAAGYTNRRIAAALFISERTVETHRSRINRKLGIRSPAELIRSAAREQLIGQ
jgi:DNA-binding NarL/FixJ family response regulator